MVSLRTIQKFHSLLVKLSSLETIDGVILEEVRFSMHPARFYIVCDFTAQLSDLLGKPVGVLSVSWKVPMSPSVAGTISAPLSETFPAAGDRPFLCSVLLEHTLSAHGQCPHPAGVDRGQPRSLVPRQPSQTGDGLFARAPDNISQFSSVFSVARSSD